MPSIKILSIDVTPNGKCFQIETSSQGGARYSTTYDVIKMSSIENECYDLTDAVVSNPALDALVLMNSRHLA